MPIERLARVEVRKRVNGGTAVGDIAGTKQCQGGNAITGMTAKSWPIARTLRSAVAAAINEAIGGTNADPVCRNDRPDPSRRQTHNTKIRGHPTSMGNRIRWPAWIGREGPFPPRGADVFVYYPY